MTAVLTRAPFRNGTTRSKLPQLGGTLYSGAIGASMRRSASDDILAVTGPDLGIKALDAPLIPSVADPAPKLTIVFDMDETLVSNRGPGQLKIRPGVKDMLEALSANEDIELVLWTASVASVAKVVLSSQLDPEGKYFRHHIFRDQRWFRMSGYAKDLRRLGRPLDRTVIVENDPYSTRLNPRNALMVRDFLGRNMKDDTMKVVQSILMDLAASPEPVPSLLQKDARVGPKGIVIVPLPGARTPPLTTTTTALRDKGSLTARGANPYAKLYATVRPY